MSVLIPVHDNEATLREVCARTIAALEPMAADGLEVVLVDDASVDGSWGLIRELSAEDPRVRGVRLERRVGNLVARALAVEDAHGEVVCTIDADLENAPEDLPALARTIAGGCDLVSAVRVNQQGRSLAHRLMTGGLRLMLRRAFPSPPRDFGCGMKAWRAPVGRAAVSSETRSDGLAWAVALYRTARSYDEVEVTWWDQGRSSSHSLRTRVTMAADLVLVLWPRTTSTLWGLTALAASSAMVGSRPRARRVVPALVCGVAASALQRRSFARRRRISAAGGPEFSRTPSP